MGNFFGTLALPPNRRTDSPLSHAKPTKEVDEGAMRFVLLWVGCSHFLMASSVDHPLLTPVEVVQQEID